MESTENLYCRFCAELKGADKVLNLQQDRKKCEEIHFKLAFVNALYVNVNSDGVLPKTVCFVCYESLNKAYEFLNNVKRAQDVLTSLLSSNDDEKYNIVADDRSGDYDDFLSEETHEEQSNEHVDVKLESVNKQNQSNPSELFSMVIKSEPKDEATDPCLLEVLNKGGAVEDNINVQDIIDAAINLPNVLYAKDLNEITKRDVKTWKDYPWVCAYCNIEFIDIEMLRSHSKVAHGKCSAFMCIDCRTVKTENFTSFLKHVRKHRRYLRYVFFCIFIQFSFSSTNPHGALMVGYGPFSLCVIHKEGLCPSSGDINRLMVISFLFNLLNNL
jgi:hypothetical protein